MKLTTKFKSILFSLCAVIVAIAILLSATAITRSKELDTHYENYIMQDVLNNVYIYDYSGRPIYQEGYFCNSELIRLSTFHLVGDKNGSITNSILCKAVTNASECNAFTGYKPQRQEYHLTIDLALQNAAYKLLSEKGFNGCIIVSDYSTGEIRCMVSTPSLDVYNTDFIEDGAFLNKAAMAYPPGSVFKAITVAAILEKKGSAKNFTYNCSRKYNYVSCMSAHKNQTLAEILSNSCNCGISACANKYISGKHLDNYVNKKNILNGEELVEGYKITNGNINATTDLWWSANGQHETLMTPLSVSAYYNAIANGGVQKTLFFDKSDKSNDKNKLMSKVTAEYISSSLSAVTRQKGITVRSFGKTGTAELNDLPSHAWFVCCLTDPLYPSYSILVFLEHAGSSSLAVEVAKEFMASNIL